MGRVKDQYFDEINESRDSREEYEASIGEGQYWQWVYEEESKIADSYPHDARWQQAVEKIGRMQ